MPDIETRRAQVFALRAQGYSQQAIAEKLGVNRGTISTDCKALAGRMPAPADDVIQEWQQHLSSAQRLLFARFVGGIDDMDPERAGALLVRLWPLMAQVYGIDRLDTTTSTAALLRQTENELLTQEAQLANQYDTDQGPHDNPQVSLPNDGYVDTSHEGR